MSNKSGVSDQVISLPQGGGALQGIGEKFSPDLFTGTGNFTVPIALPPGRGGFQPELSLVYSTGNGNGPFGLGWGLSVPGVARETSKGVPRYDDAEDTFVLSGAEDLVPVKKEATATRYRPRTEGLFALIAHHRDAEQDHDYWEVRSRDGLVSLYGTPGTAGEDPAVVVDPEKSDKVFAWKLTQTEDPFGNRVVYAYERDSFEDDSHRSDQLSLKEVRYVDYEDDSGEKRFLVSATFVYEDELDGGAEERPDPFSEHRVGFEIRTRRRCKRIDIRTHAGEDPVARDEGTLVRTYELFYLDERVAAGELPETMLPRNGVSLLSLVRVTGHDEAQQAQENRTEELPPLEFGYTRFKPEERDFFPLEGQLPARSLASPDLELADLSGDGLPDILQMNGTVRYWKNGGDGAFHPPREMSEAPAGLGLADPGVQLLDADGDGRIDLLVTQNGLSGYFPLNFDGEWDRRSLRRYPQAPSFNLEDPEVKLVDLDGDGVTDVLRSGSRFECFFNDPEEGWNGTRRVPRQGLEVFPNVSLSDPRVKWADMTGDGLQDIVLVHDGNVEYWPSLGYGDWGPRVHMQKSPRFPHGYNPERILLGDVDGDGCADLVYVDHRKVLLWINQSGNGFSEPIEIDGTPAVTDMDAVRLADVLGTGIGGLLWSADANGLSPQRAFFLDFTGGIKPYLLDEMDNHMGAVTNVAYAPSTHFYLEDEKRSATLENENRRVAPWKTTLPFPVQVVARVEVIDELSKGKLTTEYRYHHGYWDGAEREFRGFGMVEQLDTEAFEGYNGAGLHGTSTEFTRVEEQEQFSPPTLTKTWFHQGPVDVEFGEWRGPEAFDKEFWLGDPQVLPNILSGTDPLDGLRGRARRDALRSLRGRVLRTELYARDGTVRQERPYTVTEGLYGVREESPPGDGEEDRLRIFFPHDLGQRTTQWERGDEPMTRFSFTEDYSEYGQPRRQTQVACPRGWREPEDTPKEPYLATHTRIIYAQPLDPEQSYIVDRVARTTTYEIKNNGNQRVPDLKDTSDGSTSLEVVGQTLNFYDGDPFQGLQFGQVGEHGALVRKQDLILTDYILHEAYKRGGEVQTSPEEPPYLTTSGSPAWPAEYPQEFRDRLNTQAGYEYHAGEAEYYRGYFSTTERRRYDFHDDPEGRGLVKVKRSPLGHDLMIAYDEPYRLLPKEATDAVGLKATADYNYRVLQPSEVIDSNGNHTRFVFTPLGFLKDMWVLGKPANDEGDRQRPSVRLEYDFRAFTDRGQPIAVRSLRSVHHDTEIDVPLPQRNEMILKVEYSDGFGRLIQARTQAEDVIFGDDSIFGNEVLPASQSQPVAETVGHSLTNAGGMQRVVVSGWQIYDNKGRVIEKYEPFFSAGWEYERVTDAQLGQKAIMFYDPRGQTVRTVNPDGSEQQVIYGVPVDLGTPDVFASTPWETYTYDANDNAGQTHPTSSTSYQHHWNTPSSAMVDALGRTVAIVERNGPNPATDWYVTRSTYDIRGNLVALVDPLERTVLRHVYDLANRALRTEQLDAGLRRTVTDAAGNTIERRDGKGALVLNAYDELNRPVRVWARDGAGQPLTLREWLVYGDIADTGLTAAEAARGNLLGKPYKHYDEAGLLTFEAYDFKGSIREKVRLVIQDEVVLTVFKPSPSKWKVKAFRVDWQPPSGTTLEAHAGKLLDPTAYRTSLAYDALNRVKTMRYPQDMGSTRKELRPKYSGAGALEGVQLDGKTYVERIAYNAKGQRILIAYGNGVMTRYAYEEQTFRLLRMRTERYTKPNDLTYRPRGMPLQDSAYEYDLAGNLLTLYDRTPGSGVATKPNALDRAFTYDPLYRLISATGRECDTPPPTPWSIKPRCADVARTRNYKQTYQYDRVGNLDRLQHQAPSGAFTRVLALTPITNRLAKVAIGAKSYAYAYDDSGNLIREETSRNFEWDHSDRMRVYRTQIGDAEPSLHTHYLYDAGGQRVKKLVRKKGQIEATVYIDGVFEHQQVIKGSAAQENNTLHVMDDQSRIVQVRVGKPFTGDSTPAVKYHIGDHLGNSNVVIDDAGSWVNREEYTAYGETSFGSFARKQYRFTGNERDGESGLYYHGARYYAPWLLRWVAADPLGLSDGVNPYVYVRNNPIMQLDPQGTQTVPASQGGSAAPSTLPSSQAVPPWLPSATSVPPSTPSALERTINNIGSLLVANPTEIFRGGMEMRSSLALTKERGLAGPFYYSSTTELSIPQLRLQWGQPTEGYRIDMMSGLGLRVDNISLEVGSRQTTASGHYEPVEEQRVGYVKATLGNVSLRYFNDHHIRIGGVHLWPASGTDQGDTNAVDISARLGSYGVPTPLGTFRLMEVGAHLHIATGIPNRAVTAQVGGRTIYSDVRFNEISRGVLSLSAALRDPGNGIAIRVEAGVDSGSISEFFQNKLVHETLDIPEFLKPAYVSPYVTVGVEVPFSAFPRWLK